MNKMQTKIAFNMLGILQLVFYSTSVQGNEAPPSPEEPVPNPNFHFLQPLMDDKLQFRLKV